MNNYDFLKQFIEMNTGSEWLVNIPELTRENIQLVGNAIVDYQPAKDMFYNDFIVKISKQIFNSFTADNKFAFLKGENVVGNIEESYVDYISGKTFDSEDETLLKNVKATIKNLYHKVDRKDLYETSISDIQLREAFISPNGLSTLMGQVIGTLSESAEWDEFVMIKQLLVDNYANAGKEIVIPRYNADGVELGMKEISANLLFEMKKYSGRLAYVSREYNSQGLANRTGKDGQLIVLHEDMNLYIDVAVLSDIYNLEKLKIESQVVTVDNFNAETNILAILTDKRAFRYHDNLRQMETFRNPQTLTTKYMLHVWLLISMSYLFNSVYFTLEPTR